IYVYFFFSSRRRHTRWPRDWSSDVCSSDLPRAGRIYGHQLRKVARLAAAEIVGQAGDLPELVAVDAPRSGGEADVEPAVTLLVRSEERRVGKDCRSMRCPKSHGASAS